VWGSRLGTLNIGMGRCQEPQDWILRLFFGGGGGDLGSDLEPEMNPDLRFPQCPPTFLPSGPGDLPYPNSALGDGSKCRNHPQAPPSLRRPLSETDFRTWVSNLKFVT
jgi:hypothetical protein